MTSNVQVYHHYTAIYISIREPGVAIMMNDRAKKTQKSRLYIYYILRALCGKLYSITDRKKLRTYLVILNYPMSASVVVDGGREARTLV